MKGLSIGFSCGIQAEDSMGGKVLVPVVSGGIKVEGSAGGE